MKKYLLRTLQILALLVISSIVLLYLTRSYPVLLRIPPDDTIRPRYYCVLNPFRDKFPEKLAEQYLNKLREGAVEVIEPFTAERKDIPEKEKQWPIQSWRIGNRSDTTEKVEIIYWVKRGNGYPGEEAVFFYLTRSDGNWQINSYNAIY